MPNIIDYKEIGRRIELRRKELDLTLSDLASRVDLSASTIQRYEKGRFDKIKLPVLEAIASALHVNPEWLIGNTDDPIDYSDGDLLAEIPLSYVNACNGDMKRAYAMWIAAGEDAAKEYGIRDFAQNSHEEEMLLLARHMDPIPEEDRKALKQQFKNSIDLYLKAKGLSSTEDK